MADRSYAEIIKSGRALTREGFYCEAILEFTTAAHLEPDSPAAYICRGYTCFQLDLFERAIQDFNKAIKLRPNIIELYYFRGLAYGENGDYDLAIEDFRRVLKIRPTFARAARNLDVAETRKTQEKIK